METDTIVISNCTEFDWDSGNSTKNWLKYCVNKTECEQVFFNDPLLLKEDYKHSAKEERYFVLGKSNADRLLFVAFTIRNNLIRIISTRDMNKKERAVYEKIT